MLSARPCGLLRVLQSTARCLASLAMFGILSSAIDSVEWRRGARVPRTAFNHPPDQPSIANDGHWSDGSFPRVVIGFDAAPMGARSRELAWVAPCSIGRASVRAPSAKLRGAIWQPPTDGASLRSGVGFGSRGRRSIRGPLRDLAGSTLPPSDRGSLPDPSEAVQRPS